MADVLFVVVILASFGLATLLVRACDRIIGPDPVTPVSTEGESPAPTPADTIEVVA